jgi:hypothetical protein
MQFSNDDIDRGGLTMSTGAWHPDPSGRHQYRWWDGEHWTTTVSDDGVTHDESPHQIEPPPAPLAAAAATSLPLPDVTTRVAPVATSVVASSAPSELVASNAPPSPETPAPGGSDRRPLIIVLAAVAALLVAGAAVFIATRNGGDSGSGSGGSFQEVSGELTEDGDYLSLEVTLDQGQAFRFRVEPGPDLDSELFIAVDESTAVDIATVIYPAYGADAAEVASDAEELADLLFTPGSEALRPGAIQTSFADSSVISMRDPGFEGEPDADVFVALASGTFTVVAQSYDGDGSARFMVEVWDDMVDMDQLLASLETDPDAFFETIPWFNEAAFFEDEAPYTP